MMKKHMQKLLQLPPFLALAALCACASSDPFAPLAPNNLYVCDQARQMVISVADRSERALVQYQGRTISLERIPNDYGDAFTNNIFTLYINDDGQAVLEREGAPLLTNCKAD
tara:strand:+ start:94 stop:429 length:336 start_codon:yes stop_codon:yes gene_type:complete